MRLLIALLFVFSCAAHAEGTADALDIAALEEAGIPASVATASEPEKAPDKSVPNNAKESEIPLNLETKKTTGSESNPFFRILMSLSVLGVLGTGAFIFLRKYSIPKGMKTQTQIKVLQQHFLGPKKSLAIVRVAGESILIGVTDHNISMIKSLSLLDDEVPEETPQTFDSMMEDLEETPQTGRKAEAMPQDFDGEEEFAISGIKDIVSKRLKGMRNFQ